LIYSLAVLLIFYLTVTLLEYFAWMSTGARTVIFYTYLIISLIIVIRLILIPLFKLFRIGRIISHQQAAQIIGKHFSDVQDRLINTLQLKSLSDQSTENMALINASIEQKIATLQPVPFNSAIDFNKNRKYLKFAIPPMFIMIGLLLADEGGAA